MRLHAAFHFWIIKNIIISITFKGLVDSTIRMKNWHLKQIKRMIKGKTPVRLGVEIALILMVKVILLWLIWSAYFSHPIAKDARQAATTRLILNEPN